MPAKQALAQVSGNVLKRPASAAVNDDPSASSSSKKPRINPGGSSKLTWFNTLATHPKLAAARQNLINKLSHTSTLSNGCITVDGFTESTRPVMDSVHLATFRKITDEAPARYNPYHIGLLRANKLLPHAEPPPYPSQLRQVKQKRNKSAAEGNEKGATWVASHLCHNKRCVNDAHLEWEPSWFNRLRDNCPGGEQCVHRPHRCLNAHRPSPEELIDWTTFVEDA